MGCSLPAGCWRLRAFVKETGEPNASGFGGVNDPVGWAGATPTRQYREPIHYHHKVGDWFDTSPTAESDHLRWIHKRHRPPAMLVVLTSVSATEEKTASPAQPC